MNPRYLPTIKDEELKWLAVDFDGVIAFSIWPKRGIGELIAETKEKLDELVGQGYKIVIYTSRPWADYESIENFCQDHKLPIKRIVCGKVLAKRYIDDRNVEFNRDWDEVLKKIKS